MNDNLEELLTLKEAAKILRTNEQTLRRWNKKSILIAVRVGNRKGVGDRRYRKKDIEDYISRNHKK